MHTDTSDSGLDAALASYQPTSMSPATWARFRDDALALVERLDHLEPSTARTAMSRLVAFLADLAEVHPNASLRDLLTPEQVAGYLRREKEAGAPTGTVENRQGTLNGFLRALEGDAAQAPSRSPASRLAPYDRDRMLRLVSVAAAEGSDAAADFARTVLCALVGHRVSRSQPVRVEVDGARVSTARNVGTFGDGLALPDSGTVDAGAIDRGREWADEVHGFRFDLRRLVLTHIAEVVATRPAVEALSLDGVGRDRLTAAVTAAPIPGVAEVRELLRGSAD